MSDTPRPLKFLTTDELAELLHVHPETVAKWRHDHRGPDYVRVGCRPLYPITSVERWLGMRQQVMEQ